MNNVENICTFAFLIVSLIFLTIGIETKRKLYYSISIGVVGFYLAYVIYLINKNGISLFFVIQHMSALLVLISSYLYIDEDSDGKSKRNKILNRMRISFTLLMMVAVYSRMS